MTQDIFLKHPQNPIISAEDLAYRANAVFNPGATRMGQQYLLLMRVEDCKGVSHLTVAKSSDGVRNWKIDPAPSFLPDPEKYPEEIWGIEDPRITYLEPLKQWAVVYTSFSLSGPLVSIALTEDFKAFKRVGAVLVPENKDAALFPAQFGGRWALIHRPHAANRGGRANIWIAFSRDLRHWGNHQVLMMGRSGPFWDAGKIGLSTPPVLTSDGWLFLYHGVKHTASGSIYRVGAALLDKDDPTRVLARSSEWLLGPDTPSERTGDVDNVVFPCGWILESNDLKVYYGGADSVVSMAFAKVSKILGYLKPI